MTNPSSPAKLRILCIDDEPQILEGLLLHLRRHYEVSSATSGAEGLALLARHPDIAVVMSDMRMPGMDGATFLAEARQVAPDTVRLLLTGQADIASAISAINNGQIFRFLTKPCPPTTLLAAIAAAVEQHRLVTCERVLLEQTLHGSIKALTDVLSFVNPIAFGRAGRIKQLVSELAEEMGMRERWQVEVSAMLLQLGHITLPAATAENLYHGRALSADEQKLVDRLPALTDGLLGNIPRLETVRDILKTYRDPYRPLAAGQEDARREVVRLGAQLLRIAVDYDALETADAGSAEAAITAMLQRADTYPAEILKALATVRPPPGAPESLEVTFPSLRVGMVLAEDVFMHDGVLLISRGYEVTERFLERARNFGPDSVKHSFRVLAPARGGPRFP